MVGQVQGLVKTNYNKTCVKRPLKNRQNKDHNNNWWLNEGQSIAECILQYF